MKLRLDLTNRELQLLQDLLYDESQNPEHNGGCAARHIYYKLEVAERSSGKRGGK